MTLTSESKSRILNTLASTFTALFAFGLFYTFESSLTAFRLEPKLFWWQAALANAAALLFAMQIVMPIVMNIGIYSLRMFAGTILFFVGYWFVQLLGLYLLRGITERSFATKK